MKVYVFSAPGRIFGFTEDATGANLPSHLGPWKLFKEMDMNRGETPRVAVNTDECLDDIESQGYHLVRTQTVVTEKVV